MNISMNNMNTTPQTLVDSAHPVSEVPAKVSDNNSIGGDGRAVTFPTSLIESALSGAGLAINERNSGLVLAMLENGMSVDSQSLRSMLHVMNTHKDASLNQLLLLTQAGAPINSSTLADADAFLNMRSVLLDSLDEIESYLEADMVNNPAPDSPGLSVVAGADGAPAEVGADSVAELAGNDAGAFVDGADGLAGSRAETGSSSSLVGAGTDGDMNSGQLAGVGTDSVDVSGLFTGGGTNTVAGLAGNGADGSGAGALGETVASDAAELAGNGTDSTAGLAGTGADGSGVGDSANVGADGTGLSAGDAANTVAELTGNNTGALGETVASGADELAGSGTNGADGLAETGADGSGAGALGETVASGADVLAGDGTNKTHIGRDAGSPVASENADMARKLDNGGEMANSGEGILHESLAAKSFKRPALKPNDISSDGIKKLLTDTFEFLNNVKLHAQTTGDETLMNKVEKAFESFKTLTDLNNIYAYAEVPIKLNDEQNCGRLCVYSDKRRKTNRQEGSSAFLHLNMPSLGPVDIRLKLDAKKLSIDFMSNSESLNLLESNSASLTSRLKEKNLDASLKYSVLSEQDVAQDNTPPVQFLSENSNPKKITGFDTLA